MILVIDNYDSFAYNLVQRLGELGWDPVACRNDAISIADIERMAPSHIVISPGPCTPLEAGISNQVVGHFSGKVPILGVCLGHQCIGYVFGSPVVHASVPTHGKASLVYHDGKTIYRGMHSPFEAGRYHSLALRRESTSPPLEVTAMTQDGEVMGVRHMRYVVEGVQFHPESILTPLGPQVLANFLAYTSPEWPEENTDG